MGPCSTLPRLLCALGLSAAAFGGCGEAPPSRPTIPAALRVDDPAPPPLEPGRASVKASGAATIEAEGAWNSYAVSPPGFHLTSSDMVGVTAKPAWNVFSLSKDRVGRGLDQIVLFVGEARFEGAAPFAPGALRVDERRVRFDGTLKDRAGTAEVRLVLDVRHPEPVAAAPPPASVLALLEAAGGTKARAWSTWEGGSSKDERCASVVVPKVHARAMRDDVRTRLGPGWIAFVGTTHTGGSEERPGVELVIGPGTSSLDALRLARTDGVNHDLGTEAIVRQIRAWDSQYGVDVWHAEMDTAEFVLARAPQDALAFAKELYAFCPDIVDQGVESVEELARQLRKSRDVFLWWD
jgi:hypothetical protein